MWDDADFGPEVNWKQHIRKKGQCGWVLTILENDSNKYNIEKGAHR